MGGAHNQLNGFPKVSHVRGGANPPRGREEMSERVGEGVIKVRSGLGRLGSPFLPFSILTLPH
jgi:hypothetical protein